MERLPPRISIVTPSFNQGDYLEETIDSVLSQGYANLDYWVIDGGSTDCSTDIIRKYEKHLSGWVSEPDNGQADAIAKGLSRCNGEWFNWLNSDDLLQEGALDFIAAPEQQSFEILFGAVQNFDETGFQHREIVRNISLENLIMQHTLKRRVAWHQPGIWVRRELVERAGGINNSFHYRFDMEMLIRVFANNPTFACPDRVLARFRLHNESKTSAEQRYFIMEHADILTELSQNPALAEHKDLLLECAKRAREHVFWEQLEADTDQSRRAKLWQVGLRRWSDDLALNNSKATRSLYRICRFGHHDRYNKGS